MTNAKREGKRKGERKMERKKRKNKMMEEGRRGTIKRK